MGKKYVAEVLLNIDRQFDIFNNCSEATATAAIQYIYQHRAELKRAQTVMDEVDCGTLEISIAEGDINLSEIQHILNNPVIFDDWKDAIREGLEQKPEVEKKKGPLPKGSIYLAKSQHLTKIGWSKNPEMREKQLKGSNPHLKFIHVSSPIYTIDDEQQLHTNFEKRRVSGEWFQLPDAQVKRIVEALE